MQNRNRFTDFENKFVVVQFIPNLYQRGQVVGGRGREGDGLGIWDRHVYTEVYGMTGQWGPAAWHRELYPVFCDHLCGKSI